MMRCTSAVLAGGVVMSLIRSVSTRQKLVAVRGVSAQAVSPSNATPARPATIRPTAVAVSRTHLCRSFIAVQFSQVTAPLRSIAEKRS